MMNSTYQQLSWDSAFFNFKVGRIDDTDISSVTLEHLIQRAKEDGVRLLYLFLDPKNAAANTFAISQKGQLVDEKIIYEYTIPSGDLSFHAKEILSRLGKKASPSLLSLAVQSGEYSRYKLDKHFVHGEFERLYEEWLRKSLSGQLAKEVFVYQENNKELGLITLGEKNGAADIGLLSVAEEARGRHIGTKLIQESIGWAQKMKYAKMQVVTQKQNAPACALYEKMGFRVKEVANVYHFWFN